MKGFNASKTRVRVGHLPPFMASLRARAGLSQASLGSLVGLSYQPVYKAETSPSGVSLAALLSMGKACDATPDELQRIRILDALDRGYLPIPDGCAEERAARAMHILEGGE